MIQIQSMTLIQKVNMSLNKILTIAVIHNCTLMIAVKKRKSIVMKVVKKMNLMMKITMDLIIINPESDIQGESMKLVLKRVQELQGLPDKESLKGLVKNLEERQIERRKGWTRLYQKARNLKPLYQSLNQSYQLLKAQAVNQYRIQD